LKSFNRVQYVPNKQSDFDRILSEVSKERTFAHRCFPHLLHVSYC